MGSEWCRYTTISGLSAVAPTAGRSETDRVRPGLASLFVGCRLPVVRANPSRWRRRRCLPWQRMRPMETTAALELSASVLRSSCRTATGPSGTMGTASSWVRRTTGSPTRASVGKSPDSAVLGREGSASRPSFSTKPQQSPRASAAGPVSGIDSATMAAPRHRTRGEHTFV
jgi:hypothetical protein